MTTKPTIAPGQQKVLLLGATGTIGQATARALVAARHDVTCFLRDSAAPNGALARTTLRYGQVTDPASLRANAFTDTNFDVVISCLASRNGKPDDAWAIDHQANVNAIEAARDNGVRHFILVSAICVQKPRLAFQFAKLAAEQALISASMTHSIVRPTAFFKSLSGQISRVQAGKPYLMFGDGTQTACKPISDRDLGSYLARCITDSTLHNRTLPIGGPGPAITPSDQGAYLFDRLGKPAKYRQVPIAVMNAIVWTLRTLGRAIPPLAAKADFARIGQYYATESMLVWDEASGLYDADKTPSFGSETLFEYYDSVIDGTATVEKGEHSVF